MRRSVAGAGRDLTAGAPGPSVSTVSGKRRLWPVEQQLGPGVSSCHVPAQQPAQAEPPAAADSLALAQPAAAAGSLRSAGPQAVRPPGEMMRTLARLKTVILAGILGMLGAARLPGDAQHTGYPGHTNDYVNDFAAILSPSDRQAIAAGFKRLEYQSGIEAVVVTIGGIADYRTPATNIETFATGLFNDWGIGHKRTNDGVLFLVAVNDRKVRIELGGAYAKHYDGRMRRVLDEIVLPRFKAGDMSQGIRLGAAAIEREITIPVTWLEFYKWHLLTGVAIVALILSGIFLEGRGKRGLAWLCFGGALILLVALIRALIFGKSEEGFGGGSSGGGGATGSW